MSRFAAVSSDWESEESERWKQLRPARPTATAAGRRTRGPAFATPREGI